MFIFQNYMSSGLLAPQIAIQLVEAEQEEHKKMTRTNYQDTS